ncbi:MAG: NIPSNAP family protein [Bacteroidetes bacterium]|nr:NIPSNAP family protein [Bacteroidota bacterium]
MPSRRNFVKTSLLGTAAIAAPAAGFASIAAQGAAREFYELRTYQLKDARQQALVEDYWKNAAIPALNTLGIKNVGVFTELKPEGQTRIFVLIPFGNMNDFLKMTAGLDKDGIYNEKAAAYLNAPATDPAYERIESSLLEAFAHAPKLALPGKNARIFELRQYQSASESAGKKKIEMFNDKGEIDIFRRLGFRPVFFAETLIGELRPNLTYMVTFDDMAAHDSHWQAFGSDPEWKKISSDPNYADAKLVSKITSTFIVPTTYSQI